jgi:hypothetical protein
MPFAIFASTFAVAGFVSEPDVRGLPAFFFVVQVRDDRVPGETFERQRRDEPQRIGRHHDPHFAIRFDQLARQFGSLVCCDGTGHSQNNISCSAHSVFTRANPIISRKLPLLQRYNAPPKEPQKVLPDTAFCDLPLCIFALGAEFRRVDARAVQLLLVA